MAADGRRVEDGDEQLLHALTVALRPAAAEPSMAELAALRSAVVAGGSRRSGSWRRWLAGVGVVLVAGSGGTAYAANPSAPRGVRTVAHAIRLPGVESPQLTDARKALDDLEEALAEGRTDHVRSALEDVDEEVRPLSAGERTALEPRLGQLVARARGLLARAAPAAAAERDDELDTGSGRSGGAVDDDGRDEPEVESDELDGTSDADADSSGTRSSGSGTSGSASSGSSGSGTSGSGSGTSGSGTSGSSGSGTSGSSGSGTSGSSGSGTSGSSGSGTSGSSGSGTPGSSGSGSGHLDADELDD